jgi:hypothetical protein
MEIVKQAPPPITENEEKVSKLSLNIKYYESRQNKTFGRQKRSETETLGRREGTNLERIVESSCGVSRN